jgi:hypothetical protein
MNLNEELKKIDQYIGQDTEKFNAHYSFLLDNFRSEEEKKQINDYVEDSLKALTVDIGIAVDEIGIKVQLLKVSEIVSMSYIAKEYFHKTRQWLYKKVNGNFVNGKPAKFTESEIRTLNFALQDISKQIGSTVIPL